MKYSELSDKAQDKAIEEFFDSCGDEIYKREVNDMMTVIRDFSKAVGAECQILGSNVTAFYVELHADELNYEKYKYDHESVSHESLDAPELAGLLEEMWNKRVDKWAERRRDAQERQDRYDFYSDEYRAAWSDEDKNDAEANEFVEGEIAKLMSVWLDGCALFYSSHDFAEEYMDDHDYNEDGTLVA